MEGESVLMERLRKSMIDKVPIIQPGTSAQETTTNGRGRGCNLGAGGFFSIGYYWKFLSPNNELIEDPTSNTSFHSPTDPDKVKPTLHNYSVEFDRPPFVAQVNTPKLNHFKKRTRDKYGDLESEMKPVGDHGASKQEFLDCHRLDENSPPEHFFWRVCPGISS